jgi:hypothetical protein
VTSGKQTTTDLMEKHEEKENLGDLGVDGK